MGPELVRDLVSLIQRSEADSALKVLVFKSADPNYFIPHVDVTRKCAHDADAGDCRAVPSQHIVDFADCHPDGVHAQAADPKRCRRRAS